jgi:hypothetical protein
VALRVWLLPARSALLVSFVLLANSPIQADLARLGITVPWAALRRVDARRAKYLMGRPKLEVEMTAVHHALLESTA